MKRKSLKKTKNRKIFGNKIESIVYFSSNFLFRNNHRRQLEQMQSSLEELEVRSKTELSRLKSKYQTEIDELRLRYDSLKKVKSEMENHVKKLQLSVKEAQDRLIEEQTGHSATRELLATSEKRFISIRVEIDELRVLLDRVSPPLRFVVSSTFFLFRVKKLVKQLN